MLYVSDVNNAKQSLDAGNVDYAVALLRRHLPKGYSRELPRLGNGDEPLPRVYDIALNAISHGDGRVDECARHRL